jgi:hypothetical protein
MDMPSQQGVTMTYPELDQITRQVEKLKPYEQLLLMERIIALLRSQTIDLAEDDNLEIETWEREELEQLLNDNRPMTTQEIVVAGLFGGWEDLEIEDSLAWVKQQRAKTRTRYSW